MQEFRQFYNQILFPELKHLERSRRRLLARLLLTSIACLAIAALQAYIGIFLITLLLLVPAGLSIAHLTLQLHAYYRDYKPRITTLLLDYFDNAPNYQFHSYQPDKYIPPPTFLQSKIFTRTDYYHGEDLIQGKIREMPFSLCELRVQTFSEARNRLEQVFKGLFITGDLERPDLQGNILVLPDDQMKFLSNSEKAFHLLNGRRVRNQLLPEFEAFYNTYATPNSHPSQVLSTDLQTAILQFRLHLQQSNRPKEIYLSIISDKIYIALSREKNFLEPSLWSTETSFHRLHEHYLDLRQLLDIALALDVMN
jgi:hypothetical protein